MSDSNEFYDVKISQDIISEKEKNDITNTLMKNEEMKSNSIQSDTNRWCNNTCLFALAFIVSIAISATCIYIFFIFY